MSYEDMLFLVQELCSFAKSSEQGKLYILKGRFIGQVKFQKKKKRMAAVSSCCEFDHIIRKGMNGQKAAVMTAKFIIHQNPTFTLSES